MKSKIVIVGAGNVGTTLAFSIISHELCSELILVDINEKKAQGEILDLQDANVFMNRKITLRAGGYEECRDADLVIITACAPMDPKETSRLNMLQSSMRIMGSIVPSIMRSGFNGILLVVSNPVDIMTYYAWKLSGLPYTRVIGSGTVLDTARLTSILSHMFELNPRSIDINVIGEHGDSELVVWSTATIGGKSLEHVMDDNLPRVGDLTLRKMKEQTITAGWEIFSRKGNTSYGIAASVTKIVSAILNDEESILPVSVYLNGIYGLEDAYLSLPAVINRSGIREIVKVNLTDHELEELRKSYEVIRSNIQQCLYP